MKLGAALKSIRAIICGTGTVLFISGVLLYLYGNKSISFALILLGVIEILVSTIFLKKIPESAVGETEHEVAHRVVDVTYILAGLTLAYFLDNWFLVGLSTPGMVAFYIRNSRRRVTA
ncbi:hypothetical protein SAMN05421595_0376 [Austwickia chelonae]|uniref:Uncharacterized protein n=1 Tax=Austwickia chelonae NBRC 105200 TaxID=1184607 RepID=K6VM86_9MICO|nr:hypothetical protein [Austwickia chelonae]GAB77864.1 hypothetical protein AUCHE_08_01060 [Austwickia chelonae NBRC 105200]SEV91098.1 hypothetical protein SAMN05421595_0376 [Austwickia chelonae]